MQKMVFQKSNQVILGSPTGRSEILTTLDNDELRERMVANLCQIIKKLSKSLCEPWPTI